MTPARLWSVLLATFMMLCAACEAAPLIPRAQLLKPRNLRNARISPDGRMIAFIAPDTAGVDNVWVREKRGGADRLVTHQAGHGIDEFQWSGDSAHLIYERDTNGDELAHVHIIDLQGQNDRDLTPFAGARAQNVLTSTSYPREILVGLNRRDPRMFDMYRIDLQSGRVTLDTTNPGDVLSWTVDSKFKIRAATAFDAASGDTVIRVRDDVAGAWRDLERSRFTDNLLLGQVSGGSVIAGFAPADASLYVISAVQSDTGRLIRMDIRTGRTLETVAADARSDVAIDPTTDAYRALIMLSPRTHRVQAVAFEYTHWSWQATEANVGSSLDWLAARMGGFPIVVSRDQRDESWIVQSIEDDRPSRFYLFERRTRSLVPLNLARGDSTPAGLVHVRPVIVPSRDGRSLVSYLTLPSPTPQQPLPLVLFAHGGPWIRDDWGFTPEDQLLANRGYAVLRVNFRGSTGFGKDFLNAGTGQLGLAMQDDLEDGVRWAISQAIADPKRIAIMGYSGGGYATLRGLTRSAGLYACGVDIVGPSDLGSLLSSFPPWMQAVKSRWIRRIGDVENDEALRRRLSPFYEVDKIAVPVLVGAGAQDPRVSIKQSDLLVAALRQKQVPVTYIVYPDEGHGFTRPENNLDFFGRVEEFLGSCLQGGVQPWEAVAGASAEVH